MQCNLLSIVGKVAQGFSSPLKLITPVGNKNDKRNTIPHMVTMGIQG